MDKEFIKAKPILQKLHQAGFEAYFVGGSVRDFLLDRKIHDVDVATSAMPEEVMEIFPKHVPIGLQHGTVLVFSDGVPCEVTTFRTESDYEDYRRPSHVSFVRSLKEDMKRRDFTMNAIAMDETGALIDLFGGEADLQKGIIRTVGNPQERFSEDALRMMRALRFASTLGFQIEEGTKASIMQLAHLLQHISVERITAEFEKLLMGDYVENMYQLIVSSGLGTHLPNLFPYVHKVELLSNYEMSSMEHIAQRWALFLLVLEVEKPQQFLRAWRLPKKQMQITELLVHQVRELNATDWDKIRVYELGLETALSVEQVQAIFAKEASQVERLTTMYAQLPIKQRQDIVVTGADLIAWCEKRGGAWVSAYLGKIEQAIITGTLVNERESIKQAVMSWAE